MYAYDPGEVVARPNRSTYVIKDKIPCRLCKNLFTPKKGSHKLRDWCYEYRCEMARENEHTRKVNEAQKRRKTRRSRPRVN